MGVEPSSLDAERLRVAMMGNGDPKKHLTLLRKRLLRALLDTPSAIVHNAFGLTPDEFASELEPLVQAGLVTHDKASYQPTFLVVAAEEVAPVVARARQSAAAQLTCLTASWPELHREMCKLEVTGWALPELASFLIGDWLLDQSVLAALAQDRDLMPPAPKRPSPEDPDAQYYLWLVEGTQVDLGRYGQRAHALPWESWYLITFGEYGVSGFDSDERAAFEARAKNQAEGNVDTPVALAQTLGVPAFPQNVTSAWLERVYPIAEELVRVYHNERPALENLYRRLKASRYLPSGLGEFICWYDHLVFAQTIDLLLEQGKMAVPSARFVGALWQDGAQ